MALGGSSYAAVRLSTNSVRSTHIANGQVKRADLGANAVNSAKVGNGSLFAADFAPGQLPQGEKGETGAAGSPGAPGAPGAPGSPAASLVMGNTTVAMGTAQGDASFLSPSGASAISGSNLNRQQASPNAPIVVRDLTVVQTIPSGATGQFNYRLKNLTIGPNEILLSCSIAGASATQCDSGSQTATVAAGSELVFEVFQSGTAAAAGTFAGWGWRATTP